jgi:hypothetical protein
MRLSKTENQNSESQRFQRSSLLVWFFFCLAEVSIQFDAGRDWFYLISIRGWGYLQK